MSRPPSRPKGAQFACGSVGLLSESAEALPERGAARLAQHAALIRHWGKLRNLVGAGDMEKLETRHIEDSLSLLAFLQAPPLPDVPPKNGHRWQLVDVGSGAGFPGLPLAIARPDIHVTLVERSESKGRFLRQAVIELGLSNATVCIADANTLAPGTFQVATARAVAPPPDVWPLLRRLLCPGGVALLQARRALAPSMFPDGRIVEATRAHESHIVAVRRDDPKGSPP